MLEGQRNAVNELFNQHIAKDKRHEMVNCFFKNHVEKREFPEWYMGFFRNEDNEGHDLLELIDFKEHPAGKFFRDKLAETQQNFQGKYPIPPDYQVGNEISWIMEAMCSPSMRLIFQMTHNTEVAFETLRLKLGLDCLKTGVILTDVERNIIYLNRGAMTLLNATQSDIQKEMPNFSAEHLIGNKIDFFKNIDHEIHLLNGSNHESINTLINIGELLLRLTVSEFVNECGQKLGFAIEIEETTQKSKS
jgi:PAS domain-containing protein